MLSVKYYLISPQQAYSILLALYCRNCSTFNVGLIRRMKVHLSKDVTHPTDMNFHLNYSAVINCQNKFKFKVTNYNTFALKIYSKFIEFTI